MDSQSLLTAILGAIASAFAIGKGVTYFKDRKDNSFCLSPTNEEAIVDVFRNAVTSYKDLPVNLYQIKTKVVNF